MLSKGKKGLLKDNKDLLKQELIDTEKGELSLAEKLREKKKLQRNKSIKRGALLSFIIFIVWAVYYLFAPFPGTLPYAICKIMVEEHVPYPHTLRFIEVSELNNGTIKIWFAHTDAFGSVRLEPFSCLFGEDEETGQSKLIKARWGQIDISEKKLETFNAVMPYLVSGGFYDLEAPAPLPNDVGNLQFETDKFRKVNIMGVRMWKK